jgi:methionyl-tRNA formyltransferase
MTAKSKTTVFFGSGPVAAASLEALLAHTPVEAVITKPAGGGHRTVPPVEVLARERGLPLHFAGTKAELTALLQAQRFESTYGIVVDYGVIIALEVIDAFPLGIINSHFSLLPLWRGADPITFSLLSGNPETGVSIMLINEKLDEGELLARENTRIEPDWTTAELTHHLVTLSNDMLTRYLPHYLGGKLKPYPQDASIEPTFSRKLTKEDGRLDWTEPAQRLALEVRAFQPWPKSYATLGDLEVTVTAAHAVPYDGGKPGDIVVTDAKQLLIVCGEGALAIDTLKPAGKAAMDSRAFLAGYQKRLFPVT